jgi:hypothetical protein
MSAHKLGPVEDEPPVEEPLLLPELDEPPVEEPLLLPELDEPPVEEPLFEVELDDAPPLESVGVDFPEVEEFDPTALVASVLLAPP